MNIEKLLEIISNVNQKTLAVVSILVIGLVISFFISYYVTIAFLMAWLNKVVSGLTRRATESFGVEFLTISVIIVGMFQGPVAGFIYGFVVFAFIDVVSWIINPPFEATWFPIIPSPDTLIDGIIGIIAGLLTGPFFYTVIICLVIKNILVPIKDRLVYDAPIKPIFIFNIITNLVLAILVDSFLI